LAGFGKNVVVRFVSTPEHVGVKEGTKRGHRRGKPEKAKKANHLWYSQKPSTQTVERVHIRGPQNRQLTRKNLTASYRAGKEGWGKKMSYQNKKNIPPRTTKNMRNRDVQIKPQGLRVRTEYLAMHSKKESGKKGGVGWWGGGEKNFWVWGGFW